MSVNTALGITVSQIDELINGHWSRWQEEHPFLPNVGSSSELRAWLSTVTTHDRNVALRALAREAHVEAGNDPDAALVLAWVLLPTAAYLAHRLRRLDSRIDHHIAAQLWLEVRSINWWQSRPVAMVVMFSIRRAVYWDLGLGDIPCGLDPLEGRRQNFAGVPIPGESDDDDVDSLLGLAEDGGVLSRDDVALLSALMETSRTIPTRSGRSVALLGERVTGAVAPRLGVSARTVRRRARHSIDRLANLAIA